MNRALLALGSSFGGLDLFRTVLSTLPRDFPGAVVLVPHRGRDGGGGLVEVLQRSCPLPVQEALDKEPLLPSRVYVAPADYHLLVDSEAFALSTDSLVNWARPSIDVFLESAAVAYGQRLVAIILSGAGKDGAEGLAIARAAGGLTAVQHPDEAVAPGMPTAALARAAGHQVLRAAELGPFILGAFSTFRHAPQAGTATGGTRDH